MAFPITHIKATNLELTENLETLVEQKLSALDKFIGDETDVKCDVELERMTGKQSGDIFRAEGNIVLAGKMFRAEATTDQIEKSIDEMRDELDKEMRRSHKKHKTLLRKGGQMIKDMLRFGN